MSAFKFKALLGKAPDGKPPAIASFFKRKFNTFGENNRLVMNAFLQRNENRNLQVKSTVKYPAAQIVGDRIGKVTAPATTAIFGLITSWSATAQAVVGSIAGEYMGNVLAFATAWYIFNIVKYSRKGGMNSFVKETGSIILNSLAGIGIKLAKQVGKLAENEQSKIRCTLYKIAKPFIFLGGVAISPVAVSYYAYGAGIAICVACGATPVIASIIGGFGTTAIYMTYSNWLNRSLLKKIDGEKQN